MTLSDAVDSAGVIGPTLGLDISDSWLDLEFTDRQRALNAGYGLLYLDKVALRPALFAVFGTKAQSFGQGRSHGTPMGSALVLDVQQANAQPGRSTGVKQSAILPDDELNCQNDIDILPGS